MSAASATNHDFLPSEDKATPEYVLATLADEYRHASALDPGNFEFDLTLLFTTTLAEYADYCLVSHVLDFGRAWNQRWGLTLSDEEWREVLEPEKERTLGDVCRFLAPRITRPGIRPARILGKDCLTAGAFLTVRTLLRNAGADVEDLAPSTPLARYTRRDLDLFLGAISRLAPNRLPTAAIRCPGGAMLGRWLLVGGIGLLLGNLLAQQALIVEGWLLIGVAVAGLWIALHVFGRIEFGELVTFRDLAKALVEDE